MVILALSDFIACIYQISRKIFAHGVQNILCSNCDVEAILHLKLELSFP